jgi:hypothetical protein
VQYAAQAGGSGKIVCLWRKSTVTGASVHPIGTERALEHDPEKWVPVFRKVHAQTKI